MSSSFTGLELNLRVLAPSANFIGFGALLASLLSLSSRSRPCKRNNAITKNDQINVTDRWHCAKEHLMCASTAAVDSSILVTVT